MHYIIARKRQGITQIYMSLHKQDWTAGEFRDPNETDLPLEFPTKFHASWVLQDLEKKEPNWSYELREYLR